MQGYYLNLQATLRLSPDRGGGELRRANPGETFTVITKLPADAAFRDEWLHIVPPKDLLESGKIKEGQNVYIAYRVRGAIYGVLIELKNQQGDEVLAAVKAGLIEYKRSMDAFMDGMIAKLG